jgi:catechol 2,3-dioxygenase-like lactoylglutathione lyase family enzyme
MKFDHVAFVVPDISQAVEWYYQNVPNLKVQYEDDDWAMLVIGGEAKIALVLPGHHPPHVALLANGDEQFPCDASEIKQHRDGSRYYYLSDPYGNAVEWIDYGDS